MTAPRRLKSEQASLLTSSFIVLLLVAVITVTVVDVPWVSAADPTTGLALAALLLSIFNTWNASLRPPDRDLRFACIAFHGVQVNDAATSARIRVTGAFINTGEVQEVVLNQLVRLGTRSGGILVKTAGVAVPPLGLGQSEIVPPGESRPTVIEGQADLRFYPRSERERLFPKAPDAVPVWVQLTILDPSGDEVTTEVRVGRINFTGDQMKGSSGSRPVVSLLGDHPDSVRWHASATE